jgi:hypothetical protein
MLSTNISNDLCMCWFFIYLKKMHSPKYKIRVALFLWYRCDVELYRTVAADITVSILSVLQYISKGKANVHPRTAHEGPQGKQSYSCTISLTTALDKGGWSPPRSSRFTTRKDPVPIVQEAGWAPRPVWADAKILHPTGAWSPDRPARSESYRLSCPGSTQ